MFDLQMRALVGAEPGWWPGAAVGAAGMVAVGGKEPRGSLTPISADRNSLMKAWS